MNKTGIPLVFRREGESIEASGQFEEHERARSLTPLLFSYIDEESMFRCQMRVGKFLNPDQAAVPMWYVEITLLLKAMHAFKMLQASIVFVPVQKHITDEFGAIQNLDLQAQPDKVLTGNSQSSQVLYREGGVNYSNNPHIRTYSYGLSLIRFLLAIHNLAKCCIRR